MSSVFVYDPTENDPLSKVRGVGRYLQILKENFPNWQYRNKFEIRNSKFEIFINPFFNLLQPPLTLRRIARKQIAVIHDLIPLKYPEHFPAGIRGKLNIFLNKLAIRNYDVIVTDSEASKKDIIDILYIEEKKIRVIYPCLPRMFEVRSSKLEGNKIKTSTNQHPTSYCLYVGDATWNKNLVNLVRAIKTINVTCVFVGKVFEEIKKLRNYVITQLPDYSHPWQQELREFLKEVSNDKRFIFLGFIPDEQLIQLYRQANCNILVSRDEGFGFSYLEAASQNCPSVLSDIPVLRETSGSQGALFAKPDNANDIANAIGEVYFNQDIKTKLGKLAQERVKYFSQKKFFAKFLNILNS